MYHLWRADYRVVDGLVLLIISWKKLNKIQTMHICAWAPLQDINNLIARMCRPLNSSGCNTWCDFDRLSRMEGNCNSNFRKVETSHFGQWFFGGVFFLSENVTLQHLQDKQEQSGIPSKNFLESMKFPLDFAFRWEIHFNPSTFVFFVTVEKRFPSLSVPAKLCI